MFLAHHFGSPSKWFRTFVFQHGTEVEASLLWSPAFWQPKSCGFWLQAPQYRPALDAF